MKTQTNLTRAQLGKPALLSGQIILATCKECKNKPNKSICKLNNSEI